MAFTGYNIFPGFTTIGVVNKVVKEAAVSFNLEAINALNQPPDTIVQWAEVAGVTPAVFEGRVPIDFTALNGFEPFQGTRSYKQIDVAAINVDVNQWQRNLEWDIRFDQAGNMVLKEMHNVGSYSAAMVAHARAMKARLCATIFMQGTPSLAKALVYSGMSSTDIPGAGKSLFNTAHLSNPLDAGSRAFSNYYADAGKFDAIAMAFTCGLMQQVPSPVGDAETLGLQVTDIIGPTTMAEPFRQVATQNLFLQVASNGATSNPVNIGAATTNIYASGSSAVRFWIAPQLNGDTAAASGKHLWISVSRTLPGARPIEMVGPSKEFMPRIQLMGDGTEMAATTRKIHLLGDLDAGAAAGLPHVVQRFEEGTAASRDTYRAFGGL